MLFFAGAHISLIDAAYVRAVFQTIVGRKLSLLFVFLLVTIVHICLQTVFEGKNHRVTTKEDNKVNNDAKR